MCQLRKVFQSLELYIKRKKSKCKMYSKIRLNVEAELSGSELTKAEWQQIVSSVGSMKEFEHFLGSKELCEDYQAVG